VTGYRITKQAARDLKEIWHYTATNHSESQADRYVAKLKAGCTKITANPTIRRVLKLVGSEVRLYECEHHFIVYLADDAEVVIIAFLHERMDFVARLKARLSP
jgi:toxin ParE1/3/4